MPVRQDIQVGYTLMLLATESATCSLVITPATSAGRGTPRPRTTRAIPACLRQMRWITSKTMSSSRTIVKLRLGEVAQSDTGWRCLPTLPERRVDAQHAQDAIDLGDRDMAHPAAHGRAGRERRRSSSRAGHQNHVGIHHFLRAADQEHVRVQRLRHDVPAPEELQGVDVLARQQAPHADAERDGEDHRQDDVVVARHLEDHRDSGHHRAGAAAHHRSHPDHGEGRDVDRERQMEGRKSARRRRRRSSRPCKAKARRCRPTSRSRG